MIDRKIAPEFNRLTHVTIPKVESKSLSNGRNVFYIDNDHSEVFKIELIIKAGSWFSKDYSLVPLTLKMLNEGTQNQSGTELANAFDSLGSFTEFIPGFDNCSLSIYGLSRYFSQNIELLSELIFLPSFDEKSFKSLKLREVQRQKLNLEKSNYKASVNLRSNIFGPQHPYGIKASTEAIEQCSLSDCHSLYQSNYSDFDILISGRIPADFLRLLDRHFGKSSISLISLNDKPETFNHTPSSQLIERDQKFVQSSIRLGKRLFNRTHEDYMGFILLNEVLGGYFGSRLMKNIREEKGFTYGIYSQLYSLNQEGYFSIGTDVNTENESETLDEIHREINLLRTSPIDSTELNTVKNYMAGTFAGSINSAFSVMDKFKATYYQGLDMTFFNHYIQQIDSFESSTLQELAQKHLLPDDLSLAIVGK